MLKTILAVVAIGAIFIWFCYSLWHDGYNDGMLEERRKRTRLMAQYNMSMSTFRTEIRLLRADLNDIKKNVPCARPERFEEQVISARMLNDEFEPKMTIEEVENG